MEKKRVILSLLLCGVMLYYAMPHLVLTTSSLQGIFSISWLTFALFVAGGNLSSLLYAPRRKKAGIQKNSARKPLRQRG
ncbi:hypothetical protein COK01_14575 [Priestia megaterium]|uniref:hypothetical protein n=1 Tax=Priestia megaterium TaxID=1404 RepID=UPI000BF652BF|nr:hypothetical protein [Priestia megaterium]PFE32733.1 hypothetical protein CN270_20625 [Priestia megaterium]PFP49243.1 hypothetical protein COK01_14575 [Priestia megaterium]PGX20411.1 hypothetical protein COE08_13455 [Priestia megaterium]